MKIWLNMVEWIDGNNGKKTHYPLYESELDATEHLLACDVGDLRVSVKKQENCQKNGRNHTTF